MDLQDVVSTDPDELEMGEEGPVRFYGTEKEPDFAIIELKDKGKALF